MKTKQTLKFLLVGGYVSSITETLKAVKNLPVITIFAKSEKAIEVVDSGIVVKKSGTKWKIAS
jgi:hypothetical protein